MIIHIIEVKVPTFQRPSLASERMDFGSQLMWMIAPRDFIIYTVFFLVFGMLLPEPTYSGPENVVYFRTAGGLEEELQRDKRITWLVVFYTVWNPSCTNFAPLFAQLSAQ
jgi:hypothetical protein